MPHRKCNGEFPRAILNLIHQSAAKGEFVTGKDYETKKIIALPDNCETEGDAIYGGFFVILIITDISFSLFKIKGVERYLFSLFLIFFSISDIYFFLAIDDQHNIFQKLIEFI